MIAFRAARVATLANHQQQDETRHVLEKDLSGVLCKRYLEEKKRSG